MQSVDTTSMAAMNRQIKCGNNIIKLINHPAASISPDGGNLDMAGMKGTLDADAATIKNPESAKSEKTEKEKLYRSCTGRSVCVSVKGEHTCRRKGSGISE